MTPRRQGIFLMLVAAAAAAGGLVARAQQTQGPVIVGDRSVVPHCPSARTPGYGLTSDDPVKVGGGPMFGAVRQRRYLDALRGPGGQVVQYKRTGTSHTADGTIVDIYELTYDGLEKPTRLYMDWYHYREQSAPQGFVCGQPFDLGPPPVDPFRAGEEYVRLALEQGPSHEFAPMPLDADGSPTHGVMFDQFRLIAREARAAADKKAPLDAKSVMQEMARPKTVLIAYPVTCDGRSIAPTDLEVVPVQGAAPPRQGDAIKGAALAALIPGFTPPASSIAVVYGLQNVRPLDRIKIKYAEPVCPAGSAEISLTPRFTPIRPVQMPSPSLPQGAEPADTPVHFQVVVDPDGLLQRPFLLGGAEPLITPAVDVLKTWRAEPARLNGAPLASSVVLQVRFK